MSKRFFIKGLIFVMSTFLAGITLYLGIILLGNYAIDNKELVMNASTIIEDQEGELITKLFVENRELVSIEDIPDYVQNAFVAVEDHRFYNHQGIDFRAIGRAVFKDLVAGAKVEGGSTITQQLAKNVFLSHEKTWLRKTKEVLIAMNLEHRYSKDELLEMYLNRIYFGHGAHGIQAASELYFDKDVNELTIEEGALLAALPKAPNYYSPIRNPEGGMARRNIVLSLMERHGYLEADETVRLQGKTIVINDKPMIENAAYLSYIDLVLEEAEKLYQISQDEILKGGYRIVVEMNPHVQQVAYNAFQDEQNFPIAHGEEKVEGSLVLIDHQTGGVIALQGGRDYVRKGLNRATTNRQPGSVFKPVSVFAPALETGEYNPYSLLRDELIDYNGYTPRNYNHKYQGEITMFDAVKESANAPAVWLLNQVGVSKAKNNLSKLDIELMDEGLAIALGGLHEGVSPLQMAASYGAFANGGIYHEPHFIREIYDRNGEIYAQRERKHNQVFLPQTAWYMTRMLEAVVKDGTGRWGEYDGPLAGKTGTTSFGGVDGAIRDIWFSGYTPEWSGAIWMGYDRTEGENYLTDGSDVPTRLFKEILTSAYGVDSSKELAFHVPPGVQDLAEPIRFVGIEDLSASVSIGWRGPRIKLQWSGSEDDRLHYYIYEKTDDGQKKIAEVQGDHEFTISGVNIFSLNSYMVVPFNPQIDREGEPSNVVRAKFPLFSQEDKAS